MRMCARQLLDKCKKVVYYVTKTMIVKLNNPCNIKGYMVLCLRMRRAISYEIISKSLSRMMHIKVIIESVIGGMIE
jgi:hypothetical protein